MEDKYNDELFKYQHEHFIHYLGLIDDMLSLFKKMNCIVLPSYYPEGMSNTLLEAASCARPIITTDRPGCREAVDNGKSGILVPEKNLILLVEAIEKFLSLSEKEQASMGMAGRRIAEKKFNRDSVVNAYLQELGTLTYA